MTPPSSPSQRCNAEVARSRRHARSKASLGSGRRPGATRRDALAVICALVLAPSDSAAQSPSRLPRIGVLYLGGPSTDLAPTGLGLGLRDLGYVEGRNVAVDYRYAAGRPDRLDALAQELVQAKVDVIVTGGPGPFLAARRATETVPIVTVGGSDPVAEGWARTLARPGSNATGFTVTFPELQGKRLELMKEALPQAVRIGVLHDPDELTPGDLERIRNSARDFGLQFQHLDVRRPADLEAAFRLARDGRAQAIFCIDTPFVVVNRTRIAEFAARERLPVIGEFPAFGAETLLMAYGADIEDLLRRAASVVDRILKGARPGDIPIERPTKLDLLLNLKVARTLDIAFPRSLLLRADRVIE